MGKVKIEIHCYLIADSLPKFYRNICWVVLRKAYHVSPNLSIWLVAMATERLNLRNNIKNQLLRNCKWDKAELGRLVHNIGLYKIIAFYFRCLSTLVDMATLSFYRLIMGKLAICYFNANILTKIFRTVCWVVLYQIYTFCQNLSIWLLSWQPKD